MFASVLIANRGEIACRIAATARRLGLRTIAVYSDADRGARHVRLCDEAHPIGPAPAVASYLNIGALLDVARRCGAACVHPGYGFLAENPHFAEACAAAGIAFIGPPADAIRAMGLKDRAKALMEKAGVPVVPGYHGERQEPRFLKEKAYEIGYPLLIKPVAGGGGKGMRKVERHAEFEPALEAAMREAQAAFGDRRVLLERYVATPRHIEVQIFADRNGNVIHLNERDCSLQRRHQKVVEEAPAPGMTAALRAAMGGAAVKAAAAVGYVGAGTVEFIADAGAGLREDRFWFLEMNTRLQVEHPVTEAVTGLDLVEWQFRIAAGEPLPLRQADVPLSGHAIEARVYAEDVERGFLPSTGRLIAWQAPQGEGIRIDSGVEAGDAVSPHYDPMIAKVIAHASARDQARQRLLHALEEIVAAGPRTNLAFLIALLGHPDFARGGVDTGFIDRSLAALGAVPAELDRAAAACGIAHLVARDAGRGAQPGTWVSPWDARDGFQLLGERRVRLPFVADGASIVAEISHGPAGIAVTIDGVEAAVDARVIDAAGEVFVLRRGRQTVVRPREVSEVEASAPAGDGLVRAPMHGKLLAVLVAPGASVRRGQPVAVVEAMKMEHALAAPCDGVVGAVLASTGSQVTEGTPILRIEPTQPADEP